MDTSADSQPSELRDVRACGEHDWIALALFMTELALFEVERTCLMQM